MMMKAPSLAFLCINSLKFQLLQGDNPIPDVYELPSELLDLLLPHLPALALQNFQTHMPFDCLDSYECGDDYFINGRKRARNDKLGSSWKALFKLRWPELIKRVEPSDDWQQLYWENHLQNCVDEAAVVALRPAFSGQISSIHVSDNILRYICHEEEHMNFQKCACKELSFHFHKFGSYLRRLRLLNVLCVTETCELLRKSKLQSLVLRWIRSEKYVEPLCKLLIQIRETLTSLEFIHCNLSLRFIDAICACLDEKNVIQSFCIKTSSTDIDITVAPPSPFISFLNTLRSLHSLHFCDSHLDRHTAVMIFYTLVNSCSNISSLDLSDNNISGWLSSYSWMSVGGRLSSEKSLQSLSKLNLKGSELDKYDAENLVHALIHMPALESLNLSGNPIEDSGLRSLITYMEKNPDSRLVDLNLENCELSRFGVVEFLDTLLTLDKPLKFLSVADNALGSEVADAIINSLAIISIESLNISGIGLDSVGFLELIKKLDKELKNVMNINISKNRGGLETARFVSKLIPLAPKLISVDASYNLMPFESLVMICDSLRSAKGDLKRIDMRGNSCISHEADHSSSLLREFQHNGEPIFVLPKAPASHVPYDDEP